MELVSNQPLQLLLILVAANGTPRIVSALSALKDITTTESNAYLSQINAKHGAQQEAASLAMTATT